MENHHVCLRFQKDFFASFFLGKKEDTQKKTIYDFFHHLQQGIFMNYVLLGNSGLRVSELCLGTMTFGEEWGWGASKKESKKMYTAYRKAGGNFIDTANFYTEGTSEKIVGELIAHERESIVLATKYTLTMKKGDPNWSGNHRKNLTQSLEASLKRLKTDYIDLYWVHAWDFMTPVEEVLRALDDAVRQGKILYIGISDTPAWKVAQANTIAELRGWSSFIGLQIEYSLVERTVERELLPMAQELNLGVLAWSPLGAGVLSGKFSTKEKNTATRLKKGSEKLNKHNIEIADEVISIAKEIGCTPAQVALRWLRAQNAIPMLGARNEIQLKDNLACLNISITPQHLERLDSISKIDLGFPHNFLKRKSIREIVYSGVYDKIEKRK